MPCQCKFSSDFCELLFPCPNFKELSSLPTAPVLVPCVLPLLVAALPHDSHMALPCPSQRRAELLRMGPRGAGTHGCRGSQTTPHSLCHPARWGTPPAPSVLSAFLLAVPGQADREGRIFRWAFLQCCCSCAKEKWNS